ncbi:MAG: DUF4192 domain-containing protein [Jatrophihabitans sp.]
MTTKRSRFGPSRTAGALEPAQRISGPAELLQAVPYLLGFHPRASLVLVGLADTGVSKELVVTARLDLVDAAEAYVLSDTVRAIRDGGTDEVFAAVYDDGGANIDARCLPWAGLAAELQDHVAAAGCALVEVLLVADGRWWGYFCSGANCCPADGRPLPDTATAFAAAATFAGVVALPDREALAAILAPLPDDERGTLNPLIEAAENEAVAAVLDGHAQRHVRSVKRGVFAAARASTDAHCMAVPAETAARFLVSLGDVAVRDSIWIAVDNGRLDGRELWRDLARRAPGPYAAAPLFLFGWASWRAGNGALAGIAAEQAIRCDPGYSAADLLMAALSRGVDPRNLPKLRLQRSA